MGYHRAGFEVVGVDLHPQPRYPFKFHQADAMTFPLDGFDVIHASPPCQDHSSLKAVVLAAGGKEHGTGQLLMQTLERLPKNLPFVVENVEGACFDGYYHFRLCGSSFGLDLRRHRKFASNHLFLPPPCDHAWQTPRFPSLDKRRKRALSSVVSVHGGGQHGRALATVVGVHGHINYSGEAELRRRAMEIDWMNNYELTQAIPPAYTEWIGLQLIERL